MSRNFIALLASAASLLSVQSGCGHYASVDVIDLQTDQQSDGRMQVDVTVECTEFAGTRLTTPWCVRVEWFDTEPPEDLRGPGEPTPGCFPADDAEPLAVADACSNDELDDGDRATLEVISANPLPEAVWVHAFATAGTDIPDACGVALLLSE